MTVLIAYRSAADGAFLAGDSGIFSGDSALIEGTPKVWQWNGALIGATGPAHVGDVARAAASDRPQVIADALKKNLRRDEIEAGEVIVVRKNGLYLLSGNAIVRVRGKYLAVGSIEGAAVASGAMWALIKDNEFTPIEALLREALSAAAHHTSAVRRPFHVLELR